MTCKNMKDKNIKIMKILFYLLDKIRDILPQYFRR